MKFCPACGSKLSPESKFCASCGTPTAAAPQPPAAPTSTPSQAPSHADDDATRLAPTSRDEWAVSSTSSDDDATRVAPTESAPESPSATRTFGSERHTTPPAPAPEPAPAPADTTSRGGSKGTKIAGAALAVILLGGGLGYAWTQMKGDDSSSSTPATQNAAPGGPTGTAESKPARMPDLKGKSIDEAQALLSGKVKLETTKTNLVEGMNGGAVINSQEPAAGGATPDTVKVVLDQPANVTYVADASSLAVESNPFSATSATDLSPKAYTRLLTREMDGYADEPEKLELNLNQQYSRFRSDVLVGNTSEDKSKAFTVTIKIDNKQAWSQEVKFGETKNIDLDVTKATRLTIEVSIHGGTEDNRYQDSTIAFGDTRLLADPTTMTAPSSTSSN